MLLEELNKKIDILKIISKCREKFNESKLYGGNCGQFAYALAKYLINHGELNILLSLITNDLENEEELWIGEPDVYHVCLKYKNKLYDGTGLTNKNNLLKLTLNQYNDKFPVQWDLDINENCRRAISYNTNWDIEWVEFYEFINSL